MSPKPAVQPRNVVELRAVRHTLELYRQNYGAQVAALLATAYLVMQSLAIPGSIGINLLMGSMCASSAVHSLPSSDVSLDSRSVWNPYIERRRPWLTDLETQHVGNKLRLCESISVIEFFP